MAQISEFRMLSYKDIQTLLECEETTAKRILSDIKRECKAPKVLFKHFKIYFKV
ncbi:hypothetical protein ACSVH2_12610 [Flavobacterium sp. RSB2_4_14]|uniref:hypothetical protein n=1 Tax=Flavobacterium sp. RSB2_4_14 TaxID=3447665 RepID=UPI003F3BEDA8